MEFKDVIQKRRSCRAFTNQQIRNEILIKIVNEAQTTPSWANAQDYHIYIATRNTAQNIRREYEMQALSGNDGFSDFSFTHRKDWTDKEQKIMHKFEGTISSYLNEKNNGIDEFLSVQDTLFNAPTLVFLTIPEDATKWAMTDLGALEMALILSAENQGVSSIVAQAFVKYPEILRRYLGIENDEKIIIGIGLGYEDEEDKLNRFRSPRKSVTQILTVRT